MAQCFLCEGLAVVYCVNEKAHLCASCDAQVHSDNFIVRQHKRRWLCNECGQRPSAVFCKTDLQHFCAECDTKVHAPGSKKARHDRVPADDVGALGEQPPQYQSHNAEASSSQYRPQASPMMNGSGSSGSRNDGGIHSLANHPILSALHTQQQSLPRAPADEEPFCYWDELLYARSQAAARQRRQPGTRWRSLAQRAAVEWTPEEACSAMECSLTPVACWLPFRGAAQPTNAAALREHL
mmetsp:Transcript_3943/g.13992  ORF Transcript_3943/g.13992 Transcript_3943/m.13992 type:complete len:239 (+) Transcript_3943:347-1063(+)